LKFEEKEKAPKWGYLQGVFNVERIISCQGRDGMNVFNK
jgi:hypothetical protein